MYLGDWRLVDLNAAPTLLDWVAFVLGGLGIGFTIWQLLRSKGALKAARDELNRTRSTLIKNQLLAVLPGFEEILVNLEQSIRDDARDQANAQLTRFAYHSQEAAELLKGSSEEFTSMVETLVEAAQTATRARSSLFGSPNRTTSQLIGQPMGDFRLLVTEIRGLSVSIRNDPGNERDVEIRGSHA